MFKICMIILFGLIILLWQWTGEKILDGIQERDGAIPIEILPIMIIAEVIVIFTYIIFIFKI